MVSALTMCFWFRLRLQRPIISCTICPRKPDTSSLSTTSAERVLTPLYYAPTGTAGCVSWAFLRTSLISAALILTKSF